VGQALILVNDGWRLVLDTLVCLNVLEAATHSVLSLLVVGLQFLDSVQVIASGLELLKSFVSKTSSEVSLDKNVGIIEVECTIDNLCGEFNLLTVLFVFSVTESHIVVNSGFELRNFLFEQGEILNEVLELVGGLLVDLVGTNVVSLLEAGGGLGFLAFDLAVDLGEFGSLSFLFVVVSRGLGSRINLLHFRLLDFLNNGFRALNLLEGSLFEINSLGKSLIITFFLQCFNRASKIIRSFLLLFLSSSQFILSLLVIVFSLLGVYLNLFFIFGHLFLLGFKFQNLLLQGISVRSVWHFLAHIKSIVV